MSVGFKVALTMVIRGGERFLEAGTFVAATGVDALAVAVGSSHAMAVRSGIVKVNIATILNVTFTGAIRDILERDQACVDPRTFLAPARSRVSDLVARLWPWSAHRQQRSECALRHRRRPVSAHQGAASQVGVCANSPR